MITLKFLKSNWKIYTLGSSHKFYDGKPHPRKIISWALQFYDKKNTWKFFKIQSG